MAPVKVYVFWLSAPCRAVGMVCQKLGLDVEYCDVDLSKGEHKTEEFMKINPDHLVPTIVDDGFALWESRAIARYLVDKFAPGDELYPKDLQKRAIVDRMLDFDLCGIYKEVLAYVYPRFVLGEDTDPVKVEAMLKRLNDKVFNNGQFAAGACITLADISIVASLNFLDMANYRIKPEDYPNIITWMKKIKAADFYGPIDGFYKKTKAAFAEGKSIII